MPRPRARERPFVSYEILRHLLCQRPLCEAAWLPILAEDCHTRIGCAPPVIGRAKTLAALAELFDRTRAVGLHYWEPGMHNRAIYIECDATLSNPGEEPMGEPCMFVMRPSDRPFQDIRVYLDWTGLRQR